MAFINTLYNLWPNGDSVVPGLRDGIAAAAPTVFAKYGFDSQLLIAHLMAQISLECGAGMEVVENLNYSNTRLMQVWPGRFPTYASTLQYAHNPRLLANKVYNGRMGNVTNSNDGWNFRGRGATQTTGREGYQALGTKLGMPLTINPDVVNDPSHFLECGAADFILCGCLPWAQADNVNQVTHHLNGGYTGLSDRIVWLKRWKAALDTGPLLVAVAPSATI
jgi:putative chitinase